MSVSPAAGEPAPERSSAGRSDVERPLPVRSPPGDASRFPQLEGQRGLAALLVVVFHAYQYDREGQPAQYWASGRSEHALLLALDGMVSWFFVLSAFLLTLPYARAVVAGRPGTPASRFLARRAVRIVPLYLVAVSVVWAWRNPGLPGDWRDLVEHLTFTQVFDQQRIFFTIGPAWSLAVEVQFYVLLAAVGAALTRVGVRTAARGRRVALLWGTVLGLAAASVAYVAVLADRPKDDFHIWFSLPAKLVVFACGMALAVALATRPLRLPALAVWALRAGSLAVVLAAAYGRDLSATGSSPGWPDAVFHGLFGLAAGMLVLASVAGHATGPFARVLGSRALVWLGLVSYSLYLWHEPLLLALADLGLVPEQAPAAFPVTAVVLVAAGLVVAWASYWLIEYPASHLRTRIDGGTTPAAPIRDTRPAREEVGA